MSEHASSKRAASPLRDQDQPREKKGKTKAKETLDTDSETQSSSSPSVDPIAAFFASVVNPEQKAAWELAGKAELAKAVGGALDQTIISDLQKITVAQLEPSHRHTFVWKLKKTRECTSEDWNNSPATNVTDRTADLRPNDHQNQAEKELGACDGDDEDEDESQAAASPSPYVSRVGGMPYLNPDEEWPICGGGCDRPLSFFFQLLLSDLPEHLGHAYRMPSIPLDKQLLQFFLCIDDCDTFDPYMGSQLVRLLDISSYDASTYKSSATKTLGGLYVSPDRLVTGWTKKTDYPHSDDFLLYSLNRKLLTDEQQNTIIDEYQAIQNEKLGGFPCFVHASEYWRCRSCRKEMRFLFQISGETWIDGGTDMILGDGSQGHIMQCASHPEVLAFGWQR